MIELCHLTKRYDDATAAVDDVSLEIADGELVVLLGGSGSGKTTTLKMINGLVAPSTGCVLLDGEDTQRIPPHLLRRRIGYVFQRVGLFPHMTVGENVAVTPKLAGWDPARIRARVDEALTLVELDPSVFRTRFPHELSGGEQQRVGVARALAAQPNVMLLDEPFGALDPLTRDKVQQSLIRIRREIRFTALFVTHDMIEALLLGDRIAVMNRGRLVQVGRPSELLREPKNEYVEQLMATPKRQVKFLEALIDTDERVDDDAQLEGDTR